MGSKTAPAIKKNTFSFGTTTRTSAAGFVPPVGVEQYRGQVPFSKAVQAYYLLLESSRMQFFLLSYSYPVPCRCFLLIIRKTELCSLSCVRLPLQRRCRFSCERAESVCLCLNIPCPSKPQAYPWAAAGNLQTIQMLVTTLQRGWVAQTCYVAITHTQAIHSSH